MLHHSIRVTLCAALGLCASIVAGAPAPRMLATRRPHTRTAATPAHSAPVHLIIDTDIFSEGKRLSDFAAQFPDMMSCGGAPGQIGPPDGR